MATAVATTIADEHSYSLSNPAKPLHHQQIERALCLQPLLNQVEVIFAQRNHSESEDKTSDVTDTEDDKSRYDFEGNKSVNGIVTTKSERKADKTRLYNFTRIKKNRKWLRAILLSDSSSDEDDEPYSQERLKEMLKIRQLERKYQTQFYQNPETRQYQYYGSGLLAYNDRWPDQQRLIHGPKKKNIKELKKMDKKTLKAKLKKMKRAKAKELSNRKFAQNIDPEVLKQYMAKSHQHKERPHKVKKLTPEQIAAKRKKIWHTIAKKEIPKAYKQKASARKEMLSMAKKLAQQSMKESRRRAIQSQKNMRETPLRAKRLTREMITYWKRFEKVEKEHRKRVHKEAQEQRKLDLNLLEARRQQRKLNFLITQTELYAHFMSRKLTGASEEDKMNILKRLDEDPLQREREVDGGLLTDELDDDYDGMYMQNVAIQNAKDALAKQTNRTKSYDVDVSKPFGRSLSSSDSFANPAISTEVEQPQPSIFEGKLKGYQLKGMNWLVNIYKQGINGILADEMGLGKTIQSMAFLAHLAENMGIWGPFLVIAPASTLHNWQQECARFIPKIKVVPYWGNTQDRRVLRKFWNQSHMHTPDASFHIIITSYQLVIQDVKYFQRIKWQYMILDEAQALKSSSSVRWKILLGFNCRNRLLLTGTPIQNSMAELWALLHFIMPTLFDSHDEFNEWFSKDIESHAEKQSGIDENQLSRLHMILKPFMLRRVKSDVENELSDKIEVLVFCPLTTRQRYLYQAIKNKIRIEDLLQSSSSSTSQSPGTTSSLMNLVMQFRKVCNHPELFERREIRSPCYLPREPFTMPKLMYRDGLIEKALPSKERLLRNMFCIYNTENIHRSIFHDDEKDEKTSRCFSFLRFINTSPSEMESIMLAGLLVRWLSVFLWLKEAYRIQQSHTWRKENEIKYRFCSNKEFLLEPQRTTHFTNVTTSDNLRHLVFTSRTTTFHSHSDHVFHCIPETIGHRKIRQKHLRAKRLKSLALPSSPTKSPTHKKGPPLSPVKKLHSSAVDLDLGLELAPQHPHVEREPVTFECQATRLPAYLYYSTPKVMCQSHDWYIADRSAMWDHMRERLCGTMEAWKSLLYGLPETADVVRWSRVGLHPPTIGGVYGATSKHGFSNVYIPDKETLVTDAGKLHVLDSLLARLKDEGHRVLIYSQMTRMIDLLEEYMWHRKHTYMRLDGSSKISDRRDMVADFQSRSDIFVFLLSTRAGGLGINLTAADTVIFYDSDWNPTVDQQAMDRAHRLGQTKQVTVYRLICKGTIEERILQRAREKSEIQRMVISGGTFRPDILKPKEVVSLLIDDDEMEKKLKAKREEKQTKEEFNKSKDRKRKRDAYVPRGRGRGKKSRPEEVNVTIPADECSVMSVPSPESSVVSFGSEATGSQFACDESSNDGALVIVDDPHTSSPAVTPPPTRGRGRGRPKGSGAGRRPRGRGRVQKALSAAEIAGAQAGMTAAYAAFGYNFKGTSGSSQGISPPPKTEPGSARSPRSPRGNRVKSNTQPS